MEENFVYVGNELELFGQALNWKAYWGSRVRRFLGARVLEVGAGLGETTRQIYTDGVRRWVCLEPDAAMASILREKVGRELPRSCEVFAGTVFDLPADDRFDSILYIDVIEHIEADARELAKAVEHLHPGGHLIILVPAHQFLYSPFDKAVGHFRRYSRRSLLGIAPPGVRCVFCRYLDSVGLLASLANRLLLRASMPTLTQVLFWDSVFVRMSRWCDPLFFGALGKSVLGVWRYDTH